MSSHLQTIANTTYDLIVIGGGINGAGVARDAALRGLKTISIEKGDLSNGTTSAPTRLIHGGLRYLEYFEFPLVREALGEREILLRIAPHLVEPLLLTIPIYRDRSRPYEKIRAGMILYDLFSWDKTLPSHRMLPPATFEHLFPFVNRDNLRGGAQYYDARVPRAERLCLENFLSAREAGATVLTYTEVIKLKCEANNITGIVCRDSFTGKEFTVTGKVIANTSGPWVDSVCQSGEKNGSSFAIGKTKKIGGTKGSHIIVEPFPGAPETGLYVEAKSDGRPFFIIPWLGMYLIGTTDIPFRGDLDRFKASNEEIDYLITETNYIIPSAGLSRQDVKFTYSGVRPLPNEEGKRPGSITRNHILYDHSKEGIGNLISLIGGKLTTYRHVGEQMVDAVFKKLGRKAPPSLTAKQPLPGCIFPDDLRIGKAIATYCMSVPPKTIYYLFSVYGAKALEVLQLTEEAPELAEAIAPGLPDLKAQIVHAVRSEFARTLVDICRRRTVLAMQADYGFELLPVLTEILEQYCGWTGAQCDRQVKEYRAYMVANCIPDYLDLKASHSN